MSPNVTGKMETKIDTDVDIEMGTNSANPVNTALEDMWKEAEARFMKMTNKNLQASTKIHLDDVLKAMEDRYAEKDTEEDAAKKKARRWIENVLNCIKLLGGIASQAASMVFGPAALCYSAISFLIEIPARVSQLYDELGTLFEKVGTSLEQFKIYKRIERYTSIDPALRNTTHELMISLVDICGLAIKILGSKRSEFKAVAKLILLSDDSGVGRELTKFDKLVQRHSQISDAVTLESVLKSRYEQSGELKAILEMLTKEAQKSERVSEQVGFIYSIENERKTAQADIERIKWLINTLGIDEDKIEAPTSKCRQLWGQRVKQSGNWIQNVDQYKAWIDLEADSDSLLLLSGPEGSGKTFLMSTIIQDLQARGEDWARKSMRTSIAYYFFPERDKKTEKDSVQDVYLPSIALKSLTVQIAKRNVNYAKEMKTLWTGKENSFVKDMPCQKLCSDLQLFAPKNDATYFLLLDGLDQLSDKALAELFNTLIEVKNPRVRILASGTGDVLSKCLGDDLNAPRIYIYDFNESDIRQYVEDELEHKDLLQETEKDINDLKSWIIEEVPRLVRSKFSIAQRILAGVKDAISEDKHTADEIKKLVEDNSFSDGMAAAKEVVAGLNSSLNANEVDELNDLLIWTLYGYRYFRVHEMKAALYLRYRRTPLQQLEKKLSGKYAKALKVDSDGDIVFDNDDFFGLFQNSPSRSKKFDTKDKPKISMTITIHNADMDRVKRFFWDLNETAIFHNFNFAEADDEEKKAIISAHPVDGHLTILQQCLELLISEPKESTKAMVSYAREELPSHLRQLREYADAGKLDISEKRDIVEKLVELCRAKYNVEKNWSGDWYQDCWFEEIETFRKWLEDKEVLENMEFDGRRWLEDCLKSLNPGVMCLKDITKMVANLWLHDMEDTHIMSNYKWVARFIILESNLKSEKDKIKDEKEDSKTNASISNDRKSNDGKSNDGKSDDGKSDDGKSDDTGSDEEDQLPQWSDTLKTDEPNISRAVEWAKTELKVDEDSLWFQKIGQTYLTYGLTGPAKLAFQQAISLPKAHWKSREGLAVAYAQEDDIQSAITQMESAIDEVKASSAPGEQEQTNLVEDLLHLATWQGQLQPPQTEKAISLYQEALEHRPNDYKTCWKLLELYVSAGKLDESRSLLSSLLERNGKDGDLTMLGEMLWSFHEFYRTDTKGFRPDYFATFETFDLVFYVTKNEALFQDILATLGKVIQVGRKKNEKSIVLAALLISYGVAMAHYIDGGKHPEIGFPYWKECYEITSKGSLRGFSYCSLAFRYMSTVYLPHTTSDKLEEQSKTAISELIQLTKETHDFYRIGYNLRSVLASYHAISGKVTDAKQLLQNDMKVAIELLSDDDPDNDYQGYREIADILLHIGDDSNALSAWSLLTPDNVEKKEDEAIEQAPETLESAENQKPSVVKENNLEQKQPRRGPLTYYCDGDCGVEWTYADDIWCCKICPDVQFDGNCLDKVRNGTLKRYVCSPGHEWLHVPAWSDEDYLEVGKDRVRTGGEIVNGQRVGGEVLSVDDWLNRLRDDWAIPRETKEEKPGAEETPVAPLGESEPSLSALGQKTLSSTPQIEAVA